MHQLALSESSVHLNQMAKKRDETAISVQNITKIYKLYGCPLDRLKESLHWQNKQYHKEFFALNNVNFEINKGETVGIIGNNGAGKSTLLKIITKVLTQTQGHITVNGKVAALLELGAGFNPEYTGLENIYFHGAIIGYSRDEIENKMDPILNFADIGDFIHQPVKTYSSGMFARLAFAVAINVEPDILIIDEALSVGDAKFQHKCIAKMNKIREKGVTILFVSHALESVKSLCNRAIWLERGKVYRDGSTSNVVEEFLYEASLANNRFTLDLLNTDQALSSSNQNTQTYVNPLDKELEKATQDTRSTNILTINNIYLENSKGIPTNQILQDEHFAICIDFVVNFDVNNLSLGFLVKDQYGIELTGQSIFNVYKKGLCLKQGEQKIIKFSTKNVLQGGQSYSIAVKANIVSLWDRSDNIQIFNDELAIVFEVPPDLNKPMWFKFKQEFQISIS